MQSADRDVVVERLLLTMSEAAERLGISQRTLLRIVQNGDIRFILVGMRRRFTEDDLKQFIERQGRWFAPPEPIRKQRRGAPAKNRVYDFTELRRMGKKERDKLK